jgi:DNA-directed RNA polymerase subunit RPC12/RpoP
LYNLILLKVGSVESVTLFQRQAMNAAPRSNQFIFVLLAVFLGGLGLLFLVAAGQGNATVRLVIGVFCLAGAGGLIYLARMRPVEHTHVHKMELDLPGEVSMKSFECSSCGATLDSKSVTVVAGAVHVNCPYCGSSYQMEEAPKW